MMAKFRKNFRENTFNGVQLNKERSTHQIAVERKLRRAQRAERGTDTAGLGAVHRWLT